jgi:hypothetical protein
VIDPAVRWNEFLPVDQADPDETVIVRTSTGSALPTPAPTLAVTPLLQQARERFTTFILPFGLAAAFFGPATETVRRRVRTTSATQGPFFVFADVLREVWELRPELLGSEDVHELERLWALPYPGPSDGDFRLYE